MRYKHVPNVHVVCGYKWLGCKSTPKGLHVCNMIVDLPETDKGQSAKRAEKCTQHRCSHCGNRLRVPRLRR